MATTGITGCPIVGNSLGGRLCMWLALKKSKNLSKLIHLYSSGLTKARFGTRHAARKVQGIQNQPYYRDYVKLFCRKRLHPRSQMATNPFLNTNFSKRGAKSHNP